MVVAAAPCVEMLVIHSLFFSLFWWQQPFSCLPQVAGLDSATLAALAGDAMQLVEEEEAAAAAAAFAAKWLAMFEATFCAFC
jgi:hypothetical protein